jgi:hypothetical protein
MAQVSGNPVRDFLSLAGKVTGANSDGQGQVTQREYKMLEQKFKELSPADQNQARVDLRKSYPELHGGVTGDHK